MVLLDDALTVKLRASFMMKGGPKMLKRRLLILFIIAVITLVVFGIIGYIVTANEAQTSATALLQGK